MLERAAATLADASTDAARMMLTLATTARSENVRLGASRAILELAPKLRESVEVEVRLAALEAAQGAKK